MPTPSNSLSLQSEIIPLEQPAIGLRGAIVLDAPALGTAFGGLRCVPYTSDDACRQDAARLAQAMTYKCAVHRLPASGGKIALRADLVRDRTAVMHAVGETLATELGDRYVTGPDAGTNAADMAIIAQHTPNVAAHQDLSTPAAAGVLQSMLGVCRFLQQPIESCTVVVQGLGAVGQRLAAMLVRRGATVLGCDTNPQARAAAVAAVPEVTLFDPETWLEQPCDFLAPCALGGTITAATAPLLRCRAVVGAANNQLDQDQTATVLHQRGVVMVPDFVANSGATLAGATPVLVARGALPNNSLAALDGPLPESNGGDSCSLESAMEDLAQRAYTIVAGAHQQQRSPLAVAMDDVTAWIQQRVASGTVAA